MDFIGRMVDEPNATKRLAFFLFVFVPGFWAAVVALIVMLWIGAYAINASLHWVGWLISHVIG
jgi:hypothetical protein